MLQIHSPKILYQTGGDLLYSLSWALGSPKAQATEQFGYNEGGLVCGLTLCYPIVKVATSIPDCMCNDHHDHSVGTHKSKLHKLSCNTDTSP